MHHAQRAYGSQPAPPRLAAPRRLPLPHTARRLPLAPARPCSLPPACEAAGACCGTHPRLHDTSHAAAAAWGAAHACAARGRAPWVVGVGLGQVVEVVVEGSNGGPEPLHVRYSLRVTRACGSGAQGSAGAGGARAAGVHSSSALEDAAGGAGGGGGGGQPQPGAVCEGAVVAAGAAAQVHAALLPGARHWHRLLLAFARPGVYCVGLAHVEAAPLPLPWPCLPAPGPHAQQLLLEPGSPRGSSGGGGGDGTEGGSREAGGAAECLVHHPDSPTAGEGAGAGGGAGPTAAQLPAPAGAHALLQGSAHTAAAWLAAAHGSALAPARWRMDELCVLALRADVI